MKADPRAFLLAAIQAWSRDQFQLKCLVSGRTSGLDRFQVSDTALERSLILLWNQIYIAKGRAVRKSILAVLIYVKWNSIGRWFGGAFRP